MDPAPVTVTTRCCIVGGGPCGMMLGFLLARAGVEVIVLEKHADFFRDFRGDTIHPSTLEVMHELGLLEKFLSLPHQEAPQLYASVGDTELAMVDFSTLPTHCKFIALMPQWDFLNFLAEQGKAYPTFQLLMQTEGRDVIREEGKVVGIHATGPRGPLEIRASLVVGADGRHSTLRRNPGLEVIDLGAPMDVLWFRLPKLDHTGARSLGRFQPGFIFVQIERGDYFQCGFVIPKGHDAQVREAGLEAFRERIARIVPSLGAAVQDLTSWDQVKLLTVSIDRLRTWHQPGLLCLGDAAHTMSPIGGVGVNMAVQDAVAAANLLAGPLHRGVPDNEELEAVQQRREWPVQVTQWLQVFMQRRVITPVLGTQEKFDAPLPVRLIKHFPWLARIPGRLIGLGIRPEHVESRR